MSQDEAIAEPQHVLVVASKRKASRDRLGVAYKPGILQTLHDLLGQCAGDLLVGVALGGFVVEWYLVHDSGRRCLVQVVRVWWWEAVLRRANGSCTELAE